MNNVIQKEQIQKRDIPYPMTLDYLRRFFISIQANLAPNSTGFCDDN